MDTWVDQSILKQTPKRLQKHYTNRRQEILSDLSLNYLPFTSDEAGRAWAELPPLERLFQAVEKWRAAGRIEAGFLPMYYARLVELRARMAGYQGPQFPETNR